MVGVAQLVRVPGCGLGGRGFKSPHSPHFKERHFSMPFLFLSIEILHNVSQYKYLPCF